MRHVDLSLYLVLDPDLCQGFEGMVQTTRIAAQNGITCLQLRAPQWKKRELVECARAIKPILAAHRIPLIINDHADVCLAVDADGVHVGQKDLAPADVRAMIGCEKVLGLSISFPEELQSVNPYIVDHLGVGPIFSTATKPDAAAPMGLDGFRQILRNKPCPVVAIGSVKQDTIPALIQAGADGVAVVSAICGQADVAGATKALALTVERARRAVHFH